MEIKRRNCSAISGSLAADGRAVRGRIERDRCTQEPERRDTMRQVTSLHRTLVVLAVGLLALAAPLVAYARRRARPAARTDGDKRITEARYGGPLCFYTSAEIVRERSRYARRRRRCPSPRRARSPRRTPSGLVRLARRVASTSPRSTSIARSPVQTRRLVCASSTASYGKIATASSTSPRRASELRSNGHPEHARVEVVGSRVRSGQQRPTRAASSNRPCRYSASARSPARLARWL